MNYFRSKANKTHKSDYAKPLVIRYVKKDSADVKPLPSDSQADKKGPEQPYPGQDYWVRGDRQTGQPPASNFPPMQQVNNPQMPVMPQMAAMQSMAPSMPPMAQSMPPNAQSMPPMAQSMPMNQPGMYGMPSSMPPQQMYGQYPSYQPTMNYNQRY